MQLVRFLDSVARKSRSLFRLILNLFFQWGSSSDFWGSGGNGGRIGVISNCEDLEIHFLDIHDLSIAGLEFRVLYLYQFQNPFGFLSFATWKEKRVQSSGSGNGKIFFSLLPESFSFSRPALIVEGLSLAVPSVGIDLQQCYPALGNVFFLLIP